MEQEKKENDATIHPSGYGTSHNNLHRWDGKGGEMGHVGKETERDHQYSTKTTERSLNDETGVLLQPPTT